MRFKKSLTFIFLMVGVFGVILFSNFNKVKALSEPQQPARYINVGLENDVIFSAYGDVYSSFRFLENNYTNGGYYGVVLDIVTSDSSSTLQISATQEAPLIDFNYYFDNKASTLIMYESFIYSGDYSLGSYNVDTPKTYVDFESNNYVYAVFDFINNYTFRVKAYYSNGTYDYLKTYDINTNRNFWFTTLTRGSDSNDYYSGYWTGYNESYDIGYDDAKNDYGVYYNDDWLTSVEYGSIQYDYGYDNGYDIGYDEAYDYGYDNGLDDGYSKGIDENIETGGFGMILASTFTAVGALLSIQLLPNISIGAIVAIPIVFGVVMFIIGRRKE